MAKPPHLDLANTWIIADTHFGHENIVGFCRRPHDHELVIEQEWNEAVPDDGTVLHLGDLSYRNNSWFKHVIATKLKGSRKLLILGNHDKQRASFYRESGFRVVPAFSMFYAGRVISFDHYPLSQQAPKNVIHIHGHIHNNGYSGKDAPFIPYAHNQINVSAEQLHYRPANLKCLLDGYIHGAY